MQEAEDVVAPPNTTQQISQHDESPTHLATQPEEKHDEHFTLANSPTRYQSYRKDTEGDHKF